MGGQVTLSFGLRILRFYFEYHLGDWSDGSVKWTKYWKSRLKYVGSDDGIFWIFFEDFCTYFATFYICWYALPELLWLY